jgi:hypothetical protein
VVSTQSTTPGEGIFFFFFFSFLNDIHLLIINENTPVGQLLPMFRHGLELPPKQGLRIPITKHLKTCSS